MKYKSFIVTAVLASALFTATANAQDFCAQIFEIVTTMGSSDRDALQFITLPNASKCAHFGHWSVKYPARFSCFWPKIKRSIGGGIGGEAFRQALIPVAQEAKMLAGAVRKCIKSGKMQSDREPYKWRNFRSKRYRNNVVNHYVITSRASHRPRAICIHPVRDVDGYFGLGLTVYRSHRPIKSEHIIRSFSDGSRGTCRDAHL